MTEKIIKIAGVKVGVKYCFATEIGFRDLSGESIDKFDATNPSHATALIMAAIVAYYQSRGEESPIETEKIMYEARPKELIETMTAIFTLRNTWYSGDEEGKEDLNLTEEEKKEAAKNV